jgi:Lon protease-like protein
MPLRLPLFPLSAVLLPGSALSLHVFEDRYRTLVRELLERPEPDRVFGVVALRQGREVGSAFDDAATSLHAVGCTAQLQQVQEHPDGRFDIVTIGRQRFAVTGVEHDRPYLVGAVELLEDGPEGDLVALDAAVRTAYDDYLAALQGAGAGELVAPDLPADSLGLSYAVAATVLVDLEDRQALLAEPGAGARLRRELRLLRREAALLQALSAAPAPELARIPTSPN